MLGHSVEPSSFNPYESLVRYFEEKDLPIESIDALGMRYCINNKVLDHVILWYQSVFSKVDKELLTEEYRLWAEGIHSIAIDIKSLPNLSQDNLNRLFVEFLDKYPQSDSGELIKKLRAGHCEGYSYLISQAIVWQYQSRVKDSSCQDFYWVSNVLLQLIGNKGERSIDEINDIRTLLKIVTHSHNSPLRLSRAQGDWHRLFGIGHSRPLKKLYHNAVLLTEKNVNQLIDQFAVVNINRESLLPKEEGTVELLAIGANLHSSVLIKITEASSKNVHCFYYDSNNFSGLIAVTSLATLRCVLKIAHQLEGEVICGSVRIFSCEEKTYPSLKTSRDEIKQLSFEGKDLLLDWSVSTGDVDLIKFWQKEGADLSQVSEMNTNLLHVAARHDRAEAAKYLAEQKIDLTLEASTSGCRPLHYAARFNYVDVAATLLEFKAEVDAKTSSIDKKHPGWTSLAIAADLGYVDIIHLLLKHGADPEICNPKGHKPLHIAIESCHPDAVRKLIEKGADINAKGAGGLIPLQVAAKQGSVWMVKLLLDSGVSLSGSVKREVLAMAKDPDVVRLLTRAFNPSHFSLWDAKSELSPLLVSGRPRKLNGMRNPCPSCLPALSSGKSV